MRQLFTESLVLTGIATAVGLALAFAGVRFVGWWNPASIPRVAEVTVDLRVLLFTAAVARLHEPRFQPRSCAACASRRSHRFAQGRRAGSVERRWPAAFPTRARGRRDGARRGSACRRRPHAAQPVVAAARAARLRSLAGADDAVVAAPGELSDARAGRRFLQPAARSAYAPFRACAWPARFAPCRSDRRSATSACVSKASRPRQEPALKATGRSRLPAISKPWASGSFAAVASPRTTRCDTMLVALINEEMARRYWAGRDPIGGRLRIGGGAPNRPWVTVVGIVARRAAQRHHRGREGEVLRAAHAVAQVDRQSHSRA